MLLSICRSSRGSAEAVHCACAEANHALKRSASAYACVHEISVSAYACLLQLDGVP